jgi:REP element-mobilizing transposase RayT
MQYFPGDLLHVYNRGNNKQQIFFNDDNYTFFLGKITKHVSADIVAYCLMPNHFHFLLLHINETCCQSKKVGSLISTELHNGFRVAQSSYAGNINKQQNRTGSLFQQNTRYKPLNSSAEESGNYAEVCFNYIHQNPLKTSLVANLEDWPYSSFSEYMFNKEGICRKELAYDLFRINSANFYEVSYTAVDPALLEKIF